MTSVVGATVHSIIDDAKRGAGNAGLPEGAAGRKVSIASKRKPERMPLFGDEREEGEDESEEGELWSREEKRVKEEEGMRMRSKGDSISSPMTNSGNDASSRLCSKGGSHVADYQTLP